MTIIDYTATGANKLKNWSLMTQPSTLKLDLDKESNFWPFHEMFQTHIENMGWEDIMQFNIPGFNQSLDLTTHFGQVPTTVIESSYQTIQASTTADGRTKQLKSKGMYTWLFSSCEESTQHILGNESTIHHRSGPLAWKVITEHAIKGDNQAVRRAQNSIHTMTLQDYDYDVEKLIKEVKNNIRILSSNGESETSILSNLLRVLKETPCNGFNNFIGRKQDIFDDGETIPLGPFMKTCVTKFKAFREDGEWTTKSKKQKTCKEDSEILALKSEISNLKALVSQNNGPNKSNQQSKRAAWKLQEPQSGQPHTIEKNNKTWHWCKYHKRWAYHKSEDCYQGKKESSNNASKNEVRNKNNGQQLQLSYAEATGSDIFGFYGECKECQQESTHADILDNQALDTHQKQLKDQGDH